MHFPFKCPPLGFFQCFFVTVPYQFLHREIFPRLDPLASARGFESWRNHRFFPCIGVNVFSCPRCVSPLLFSPISSPFPSPLVLFLGVGFLYESAFGPNAVFLESFSLHSSSAWAPEAGPPLSQRVSSSTLCLPRPRTPRPFPHLIRGPDFFFSGQSSPTRSHRSSLTTRFWVQFSPP